jgi:hypothetical protein
MATFSEGSRLPDLVREAKQRAGLRNRDIAAGLNAVQSKVEFDAAYVGSELARPALGPKRAERLIRGVIRALTAEPPEGAEPLETAMRYPERLKVAAWFTEEVGKLGFRTATDVFEVMAAQVLDALTDRWMIRSTALRFWRDEVLETIAEALRETVARIGPETIAEMAKESVRPADVA